MKPLSSSLYLCIRKAIYFQVNSWFYIDYLVFKGVNFIPCEFFTYLRNLPTDRKRKNFIWSKLDSLLPSLDQKYYGGLICHENHFHGMLIHKRKAKTFAVYFFNSRVSKTDEIFYNQIFEKVGSVIQRRIRLDEEYYIFKNHSKLHVVKCTQQNDSFRCSYYGFLGELLKNLSLTIRNY